MVESISQGPNFDDIASFTVSGAAGEFIYHLGDAGKDMYIIQEGQIELLSDDSSDRKQLDLLDVGDFFGELSLLEDQRRDASARAVTPYRLLRIDRTTLQQLVHESPDIAVRMLHRLASRLRTHEEARLRALEIAAGALSPLPSRGATSPSVAMRRPKIVPQAATPKTGIPAQPASAASRQALLVHLESGREFPLAGTGELIVGRIDLATGFTPDIDLTSLDAKRTLSRRHAILARGDAGVYLYEPKATRNGTFVNGERIATGAAIKLNDGDRVRFGTLEIVFNGGPLPNDERALLLVQAASVRPRQQLDVEARGSGDSVECTVFGPKSVGQQESCLIQVYAHVIEQTAEVERLASGSDESASRLAFKSLDILVGLGTRLSFNLEVPGLKVDDPRQSLVWKGRTQAVQFGVSVPARRQPGVVIATLRVDQDSVPVGHIKFKLVIEATKKSGSAYPPEPIGDDARRYSLAFISYASPDRDKVLARVQMLKPLGIDYFQDVLDLEPGVRWDRELYRHIDECDLFLLFWSSAALKSEWVHKEIRYALARQGDDEFAPPAIYPVIIEGPPIVPPPPELAHLHFSDPVIYFMSPSAR